MRKIYITLLLISVIILTSCDNKTSSLEFEKNVMYEVFPSLIDSIWVNAVVTYVPPPPINMKDTREYKLQKRKEFKKHFDEELVSIKRRKFKIGIVILDKIYSIGESQHLLKRHFRDAVISKNNVPDTLDYKIDQKKFGINTIYKPKYQTKIPRNGERKYYNEVGYNNLPGIIHFTRIQFDTEKKYGILYAGVNCGDMCDNGYRIFIKKENNKWIVDKIEDAWIA